MNKWSILLTFCIFSSALAGESDIRLKEGDGKDLVSTNCMTCHSLDYIQMNSVFLDKQGWEKTVDKMIKVMGAPIKPEDAAAIVAYLTKNYGNNLSWQIPHCRLTATPVHPPHLPRKQY